LPTLEATTSDELEILSTIMKELGVLTQSR
jgi:hypothetical protein